MKFQHSEKLKKNVADGIANPVRLEKFLKAGKEKSMVPEI